MKAEIREDGIHLSAETWSEHHAIQRLLPAPESTVCSTCGMNPEWLRTVTIHSKPETTHES